MHYIDNICDSMNVEPMSEYFFLENRCHMGIDLDRWHPNILENNEEHLLDLPDFGKKCLEDIKAIPHVLTDVPFQTRTPLSIPKSFKTKKCRVCVPPS